jgi:hypothetical protein
MSTAVAHIIEGVEHLTPEERFELRRQIVERVPAEPPRAGRPRVGTVTSAPVRWTAESFAPMGGVAETGFASQPSGA